MTSSCRVWLAAVWCALLAGASQAASLASFSPQGEAAQAAQVVLRFDADVVAFGDPRLPDPATVSCQGGVPATAGSGRWADARTWLYDFNTPLPPGTRCTVQARPGWKPGSGEWTGTRSFSFSTGGPAVQRAEPDGYEPIEEEQHFLLRLSGPATPASLASRVWCEAEGIGERIQSRLVDGAVREALLKDRRLMGAAAAKALVVACQRPLPPGARVQLVWGKGIAALANPRVSTSVEQRFRYQVRKPFTAEFSCERERANAPCLPVRPMRLRFSSPVPRALLAQVRLQVAVAPGSKSLPALQPVFDKDNVDSELSELRFPAPLAENTRYTLSVPAAVKDSSGRPLANASPFAALQVATGAAPAIAKFAAAPFGVIERLPEAMLPVTLRHVQGDLRPAANTGQVRILKLDSAADILAWYARVERHHERQVEGPATARSEDRWVESRTVSLLKNEAKAQRLALPQLQGGDPRPFEVVGIPIQQAGYHVVEIESAALGAALLEPARPMFVRTGVLVTNLAVHFKHGRENSVAWVTTLDKAQPVAGAEVLVHDCHGKALWNGSSDANGLARIAVALPQEHTRCPAEHGYFVLARKAEPGGATDTAFVFSTWSRGIEPWRFNLNTSSDSRATERAHTVFDRPLFRAGETVSMKHFFRTETQQGLTLPKPEQLPTQVVLVHDGSGQEFVQPLRWSGGRSTASTWNIPPAAKLGRYRVLLKRELSAEHDRWRNQWSSGEFHVEEFRVPLVDARIVPAVPSAVAAKEVALAVQMSYLSGGPMAGAALRGTALLRPRYTGFAGYADYSFEPPREGGPEVPAWAAESGESGEEAEGSGPQQAGRIVVDKAPLVTAKDGSARWLVDKLPPVQRPSELLAEVSFNDPNGETQTVATTVPLWPSAVVLGIKAESWVSARGKAAFTVLALDTAGKPLANQGVEVRGALAQVQTTRRRLVGGFYAYDNRSEQRSLGVLCSGNTDSKGLLACTATLASVGQVELTAQATDKAGNPAQAATSVWVTGAGELWFAQGNDDRIDLLPEKKRYEPGETARLQLRMPFRQATALVAVEREGVMDTRVVALRGNDPTVEVKVQPDWGPNVYISVLALRGRVRDTPWYSLFTWGWKEPLAWARSFWYDGRAYQAPTAMVDLAKPAFKLGVAAIQVGLAPHTLEVAVSTDKPIYTIRGKALATVRVTQGGKPVAGVEVAFAAVDEGLLALRGNASWDLLAAMLQERAWGVATSTAQGEVIGRRHHGRKAVAAGGGGGRGGARELFDTLLLWRPGVVLDANGEARIEVPLNDSLSSFRLVAVADAGLMKFGTGSVRIRVTQDLQVLPGLPPLVREGDRFQALLTLRNTTTREMKLRATLQGTVNSGPGSTTVHSPLALAPQELVLAAGAAQEVQWPVVVPHGAFSIGWTATVEEAGSGAAKDSVKRLQLVKEAVPVRVQQATLQQLDGPFSVVLAPPADAVQTAGSPLGVARGGVLVAAQPRLSSALPGLRRYFETYPFVCLEQKVSKAVGLRDAALWAVVAEQLPTYLDADGLAHYFPPAAGAANDGSDRLTAYLLAATHEAGFALPAVARDTMLAGLAAFVQGRIERRSWAPRADLDVRKLAAIEALARHGKAEAAMLGSINPTPQLWPTAALIDWLSILQRIEGVPEQARRLAEAEQLLRGRLTWGGTTLKFSNEDEDFWWWLMDSGDGNAARLILTVLEQPGWRDELPRLVVGHLARQKHGAWLTTTANLWGSLALDKFSAKFESEKVAGKTVAMLGSSSQSIDWQRSTDGGRMTLPWPAQGGSLNVQQQGSGKPWLTVQSLAAVPLKAPLRAGYSLVRNISAVERKDPTRWSRGDVLRVRLEVQAQADMTWVVLDDPVPAGATVLGSGSGRDSAIATQGERREGSAWPVYQERAFDAFRSYYRFMPRGRHLLEYSVRLNNPGRFNLPPTRVEAMYAPESFGEAPNAVLEVGP